MRRIASGMAGPGPTVSAAATLAASLAEGEGQTKSRLDAAIVRGRRSLSDRGARPVLP